MFHTKINSNMPTEMDFPTMEPFITTPQIIPAIVDPEVRQPVSSFPKVRTRNQGQSTIEFLITFIFSIGILFLFISLGINFTTGYLAHYATFFASRVYMVQETGSDTVGSNDNYARQVALQVFDDFQLDSFGIDISDGLKIEDPGVASKYEYVGAKFSFPRQLNYAGFADGGQVLELTTESFLGREATKTECLEQICNAMGGVSNCQTYGTNNIHITTEDNGC